MSKFIVTMKHYDDFGGFEKDSITANDFETAKRVFDKWVEADKETWNPDYHDELTTKETKRTYKAEMFINFDLAYTKITITEKKEKPTKIGEKKAELIEETTLTEIVREFDKRINNTHHQYAITHHSEMTDITLYFLCNNKESLLNNEELIDDFIHSENEADFALYGEQLAKNGITHYNSELLGENDLPKAEILKSYSYRF